jgi:hypothetical protein
MDSDIQQLFHDQTKRKPDEDFQNISSNDFGRTSDGLMLSDKLGDSNAAFSSILMHNTSSGQFLPTHSFTTTASKLHNLSFPHLEHHNDGLGQGFSQSNRDAGKLTGKAPDSWHTLAQPSSSSFMPPECIDPNTVFNPVQIQTLRYLFRATVDEYMNSKNNNNNNNSMMMISSPISCAGMGRGMYSSRSVTDSRSDDEDDDGSVTLTAAEKKLVRHTIEV